MRYCYSGEELKNTKIKCGDSLQTCVEKVNDFLLQNEDTDLSWLNEFKDEICEKPLICVECKRNPSLTYCGAPLLIIGVQSGDHYDIVFEKIDEYLSTIVGSVLITNSNNSYSVEVDCGQQVMLPNVSNIDSNGSVVSVPAQTPFICTPISIDIDIDINGVEIASGVTQDVELSLIDQYANDVPFTHIGGDIIVDIPVTGIYTMPLKTGSSTFDTGDDGWFERGSDFFIFPTINNIQQLNHFGNKWRFTGTNGGYFDHDASVYKDINGNITNRSGAYPNDIMIDTKTRNHNDDMLGYYIGGSGLGIPDLTYYQALSDGMSFSIGSFTSGWALGNLNELTALQFDGACLYHPMAINAGSVALQSSTSMRNLPSDYYMYVDLWVGGSSYRNKASPSQSNFFSIFVRIFNISEL